MANKNNEISQRAAEKLMRELRIRNYGAVPVNASGNEDNWDVEKIWVKKGGRELCDINCESGAISYVNSYDRDEVVNILELLDKVKEQEGIFTKAEELRFKGLEKYKLLSRYNDFILAAGEISTLDYKNHNVKQFDYVTWELDKTGEGLHSGNYFGENYERAKEDFAKRSGLINKDRLFGETEMLDIHSGLVKLVNTGEASPEQERAIGAIREKLSRVIPAVRDEIEGIAEIEEDDEYEMGI